MKITVKYLAQLLYEELDADDWGDVDPWTFRQIYDSSLEDEHDTDTDVNGLTDVLERVVERLK